MSYPWLTMASDPGGAAWVPVINGAECPDEQTFFSEAANALNFPTYFGGNWDAFRECLNDLLDLTEGGIGSAFGGQRGRPEPSIQLVIRSPELVLHRAERGALGILVAVLREAAQTRIERRAPFSVTLADQDRQDIGLQTWISAGLRPDDIGSDRQGDRST